MGNQRVQREKGKFLINLHYFLSHVLEHSSESGKRNDYLSWEDYFMAVAKLASMRSKDPTTQVGCTIVNRENKIIGTGYNGFPVGISDDDLPWTKGNQDPLENKQTYVVHAEMNAIINKSMNSIEGCTLYTTLLPCNECAKMIIQLRAALISPLEVSTSGVRCRKSMSLQSRLAEVVFLHDRQGSWKYDATRKMFDLAGVKYRQFVTKLESVTITFL
uniref:dCMP deaminase n=1 Tax=Angiostrongylus cantonensis TaxID=6313 RepID=A0A0K0DDY6_ANGCA